MSRGSTRPSGNGSGNRGLTPTASTNAIRDAVATSLIGIAPEQPGHAATIFFDVSDLVHYLADVANVSGIQRVHREILRNLLEMPSRPPIRFVVLARGDRFGQVDGVALRHYLEVSGSGGSARAELATHLRALLDRAIPCAVSPGDVFVTVGAFWTIRGMGRLLQELKNARVIVGALIHDLLPIDAPEYFEIGTTRTFVKSVVEVLTFADFIVTTSNYNKASLARFMAAAGLRPRADPPVAAGSRAGACRAGRIERFGARAGDPRTPTTCCASARSRCGRTRPTCSISGS